MQARQTLESCQAFSPPVTPDRPLSAGLVCLVRLCGSGVAAGQSAVDGTDLLRLWRDEAGGLWR